MPHDSSDADVLARAQELEAVLVSLNGDFADIVRYPPSDYAGIIALQVKGHPRSLPAILLRLAHCARSHPDPVDYRGILLLVEAHRIRERH